MLNKYRYVNWSNKLLTVLYVIVSVCLSVYLEQFHINMGWALLTATSHPTNIHESVKAL